MLLISFGTIKISSTNRKAKPPTTGLKATSRYLVMPAKLVFSPNRKTLN